MMKMRNKKGFTLMEMLIVVAIIAILVAIAIPTFSSALEKAYVAADKANVRAAYAECLIEHMTDGADLPGSTKIEHASGATVNNFGDNTFTLKGGSLKVELDTDGNWTVTYTPTNTKYETMKLEADAVTLPG